MYNEIERNFCPVETCKKKKEKVKVHRSPVLSTYSRINMDFIYTVIYNIAHVTYCKVIRIMTGFNFIVITQL